MQTKEFKLRRDKLLKILGNNSIAIVFAAKKCACGGGEKHPYRQSSDFYYLTGFVEPESIAVLIPGRSEGAFILFNRKQDSARELWYGPSVGQEKACSEFGADQAFAISEVDEILPQLLVDRENIYFSAEFSGDFDQRIVSWLDQARPKVETYGEDKFLHKQISLDNILHEMRLKKSQFELTIIRKAAEITAKGHLRAMQKCKPGMYEFELEAELLYEFTRLGGRHGAFEPIVAGGANACTLHYSKNDKKLFAGELVLVDAGAEYEYYSADVSRTFPINGKFTLEQRVIYEIVLAAQTEVIKQIRPGVRWDHLQSVAEGVIAEGLIDIGLRDGKSFFMHKIGHWLGLDIHDVGDYRINNEWRFLEPGMVLTVEPGIYIAPNIVGIDVKWLGIGVRIEDDILVTDDGCEVLTEAVPKKIKEIEMLMKS